MALTQLERIVLVIGEDGKRCLGRLLLPEDLRQHPFRQGEDQRDGIELRHDDQAVGRRGADDVADVDLTNPDHAVDRRGQPGVAELHLGRFDQRLVGLDRGLELADLCLLGLDQLWRGPALVAELGVTREIGAGIGELGLVALQISLELVDLGLVGARIDLREQVAGMDGLSFGEVDADELALDLGPHDVGVVGNHGADAVPVDRHVMLGDHAGHDGDRRRRRCRDGGLE